MAEGEFALVQEYSLAALAQPSMGWIAVGDHDLYSLLANSASMQRDPDALAQYVPLAEDTARRYDHKLYRAIACRARGVALRLMGDYEQAESSLSQALELFSDLDTAYQVGQTLFELGDLAIVAEAADRAREELTRSLLVFESLGAAPDVARVRSLLQGLGHAG